LEKLKHISKRIVNSLIPAGKPDFLLVGAQKAGTTSLHFYLDQHPKLIGSTPKEVGFFSRDDNYSKGKEWYHKAFKAESIKNPFKSYMYFEATPEYLYRSFAPERIYRYNKKLKIIILLREPVKRAYSAWNMYRDFQHKENIPAILNSGYLKNSENNIRKELYSSGSYPSFEECIRLELDKINSNSLLEEPSFLRRGLYLDQIKRYTDRFGRNNVKIVGFKDVIGTNKKDTLNEILSFLKLPVSNWDFLVDEKKNSRLYPETLNENTEAELNKFYEPHNLKLFDFLGKKPNW